jgi:hypothetical protein
MKVLLVTSPHLDHSVYHEQRTNRFAQCFVPMGLVSLAGSVTTLGNGFQIDIADINKAINRGRLNFDSHFYGEAAEWISEYSPDVVGFMTECDSYHHVLQICQALRRSSEQTAIVLGCTHASATHEDTLRNFDAVDYVVRGEGEQSFPALLLTLANDGDIGKVGNLTYRQGTKIVANPEFPLIEELDSLPFPDLSKLDVWPEDIVYVEIGRGCPFRCNFCFTAPYWKRKHRIKSAERIIRELSYFKRDYGRTDFNFTHDLFTVDRRWVLDFCRKLCASKINITFTISSRTDTIDAEQIEWLAKAGCRDIYFGVETGTPEMQKAIQKDLDLPHARQMIKTAAEAGIGTTVGFIAGLPGETAETLSGSMSEAFYYLRSPKATVHMFGFGPYRGSSNYEAIADALVFDEHFVDFPLPDNLVGENWRLMRLFPEIFSRYRRVGSNKIDLRIVRAAEEFFPIVNALRRFMLHLVSEAIDMFGMFCKWALWIVATNEARNAPSSRSHQGSIEDFLNFIETFLREANALTSLWLEIVAWERAKDRLRHTQFSVSESRESIRMDWIYTNPTIRIQSFSVIHRFLNITNAANGAADFAFYVTTAGKPAIVRISRSARAILDCARAGVDAKLLQSTASSTSRTMNKAMPKVQSRKLSASIRALKQRDLVLDGLFLIMRPKTDRSKPVFA